MINHLGNVLATITDKKVSNVSGTSFTYYNAQIKKELKEINL